MCVRMSTNPSLRPRSDIMSNFRRSLTGLDLNFYLSYTDCRTKIKSQSTLLFTGREIIGLMPFTRVPGLCEMKVASSCVCTQVDISVS